ncbi:MAG: amidohydrolase family protein [Planctomycetota bacterium]
MLRLLAPLTWCGLLVTGICAADEPPTFDTLLLNGTLHDGSGSAPIQGDLGITGGSITAIGDLKSSRAGLRIDCQGLVICPGFIDLHNHSDAQIVAPLTRGNVNYLLQGCTTVVTGNCGAGPVDAAKYFEQIDAAGAGTNIAHLLPQGSLRDQILGPVNRLATPAELNTMRDLADKAMRDGVVGMSTGLIYIPGTYTPTEELQEIAKVVGKHGGFYTSHMRNEGKELLSAVDEALKIGQASGARVHISHFKSSGPEAWGLIRQAAAQIEAAQKAGQIVTADQYPYIASSTSLEAMVIPTWAREGGNRGMQARLAEPEQAAKIRESVLQDLKVRGPEAPIRIARYAPQPRWIGKSLQEIAELEKREPVEIVLEICRNGGAAAVSFGMNEDDVRFAMQLPWVATASDGRAYLPAADKPHPRSYGTFSRKIGYYSIQHNVLPLAAAIRSATGLPAEILGWTDRGYLKPGMVADVTVFAPSEFRDQATYDDPHRYSAGVKYVFVNGQPAVYQGQATGALAGRAVRRKSPLATAGTGG